MKPKNVKISTINYYAINNTFTNQYGSDEYAKKALMNLNPTSIISVFNNKGKQNPKKLGNKKIGDFEDWNVLFKEENSQISQLISLVNDIKQSNEEFKQSNEELKSEVNGLKSEVNGLKSEVNGLKTLIKDELVETKIRNVASNIVLYFLGEQPKPNKLSNRFGNKDSDYYIRLEEFIKGNNINYKPKKLGSKLDEMISERNVCIHPINLDELKEHVEKCIGYFNQFPELQDKYKTET